MVYSSASTCPKCGGELRFYDKVRRIVRTKNRKTNFISLNRLKCLTCGSVHREIPDYILPYKQYEKDVIIGVIEGLITPETLGFEDYPCELTMKHWRANFTKAIVKRESGVSRD